jgi:hypothetical protein
VSSSSRRERRSRAAAFAALSLVSALSALGCRARRGPEDEHVQPPTPPPPSVAAPVPVDRALPGELAEGTDLAFGLPLPRVMKIRGSFDDVLFAWGPVPSDQVANYVRQRVTADKVETGAAKTLFSRAIVKARPGRLIAVEVLAHGGDTELQVRDVTPKPTKEGQDAEERWRELGFKPDGTPLDPEHLR